MSKVYCVRDFMDKTYVTLKKDMDVYKAIDILLNKGVTSAVVTDEKNKIIGILSEKDCLTLLTKGPYYHKMPGGKVEEFMTKDVFTIPENMSIFEAANMSHEHFFRRLVVADSEGHMVGQITRRDLLRVIIQFHKALSEGEKAKKIAPIM